jgi:uncharacterized membrane protein
MNVRFRKRSDVLQAGAISLLALLLLGTLWAGLLPGAALAQGGRQDLYLRLVSRSNYAEITAGETKVLLLEVRNSGTQAIDKIELSALPPEGWRVEFEPDRITGLNPENSIVVEVTIETPVESAQERHEIILRADSAAVHRAISVWMTVEGREGTWLWVGVLLAGVAIAGFVVLFIKFGRD